MCFSNFKLDKEIQWSLQSNSLHGISFMEDFFSLTQTTISIATESNLSLQWLFQFQAFLETYMGLAFVQLKSDSEFWATLVLQSCWALFQNTGLKAFFWWHIKGKFIQWIKKRPMIQSEEDHINRKNFLFLVNSQAMAIDLMLVVMLPTVNQHGKLL